MLEHRENNTCKKVEKLIQTPNSTELTYSTDVYKYDKEEICEIILSSSTMSNGISLYNALSCETLMAS